MPACFALLKRAAAAFSLQAEEAGIDLRVETHPSLIQVNVDPERFHQVLGNLVANAIRHTEEDGRVTIVVEPRDGAVVVRVEDTGCGIPEKDLKHVFERFYQAEDSAADAGGPVGGLGLAIVKKIVELHGSAVEAASSVGEGSRFWFSLPVAP